ncbi:DUF4321 domain-containing protein [Sporosalibacterium faouarense]|uniref:DUF4321 domain-containing protein n=1 Tax=Sporosalibacterium faouarense TaxID=516123 RepID=UPI00141CCFEC|nr:DUF4321 domain-containing protein [Sporosalibacterium faouarense]MTI48517.1 DUF4321 domain-containing protein [Bacillota bacterium]
MRSSGRNPLVLLIVLAVGLVIGGVIGDILGDSVAFLGYSYPIGLSTPLHLDLNVLDLTFGLMIDVNVASAIGLVLAFLLYKKL